MHRLNNGDKIEFDVINIPGYSLGDVNVSTNGVDVKDLFRVLLDVGEPSQVELRGYARDDGGQYIKIFDLDKDDNPEVTGLKETTRRFVVSGKIELTLEEEIFD